MVLGAKSAWPFWRFVIALAKKKGYLWRDIWDAPPRTIHTQRNYLCCQKNDNAAVKNGLIYTEKNENKMVAPYINVALLAPLIQK